MNIDLTVILITYNHEQYIAKALDNIICQKTKYKFQIIAIDDHSSDKTSEILKKYKTKYPNLIKLFLHSKNYGTGKGSLFAANPMIASKYIAYLEGDDYWCNYNKIETQINFLEANPNFISVTHATEMVFEDGTENKPVIIKPSIDEWGFRDLLSPTEALYCHTSSYIRRNIFETVYPTRMKEDKNFRGDVLLNFAFTEHGKTKYIDEVMSVYRVTGQGVWTKMKKKDQDFYNILLYWYLNRYFHFKYFVGFNILLLKAFARYVVLGSRRFYFYPVSLKAFDTLKGKLKSFCNKLKQLS